MSTVHGTAGSTFRFLFFFTFYFHNNRTSKVIFNSNISLNVITRVQDCINLQARMFVSFKNNKKTTTKMQNRFKSTVCRVQFIYKILPVWCALFHIWIDLNYIFND